MPGRAQNGRGRLRMNQRVVTPIGSIVTAAISVKETVFGVGQAFNDNFQTRCYAVKMQFQMVSLLWPLTSGTVNNQVASVQTLAGY